MNEWLWVTWSAVVSSLLAWYHLRFLNLWELYGPVLKILCLTTRTTKHLLDAFVLGVLEFRRHVSGYLFHVHVLDELGIQVALSINCVLVELCFVNQHLCFEYCLLFLGFRWLATEQISWVNLCDCAISVLLLDCDDNCASSCLFEIWNLG